MDQMNIQPGADPLQSLCPVRGTIIDDDPDG
jgi:hypothetical protein